MAHNRPAQASSRLSNLSIPVEENHDLQYTFKYNFRHVLEEKKSENVVSGLMAFKRMELSAGTTQPNHNTARPAPCDLLVTKHIQLNQKIPGLKQRSYILCEEGLYYVRDPQKPVTEADFVPLNFNVGALKTSELEEYTEEAIEKSIRKAIKRAQNEEEEKEIEENTRHLIAKKKARKKESDLKEAARVATHQAIHDLYIKLTGKLEIEEGLIAVTPAQQQAIKENTCYAHTAYPENRFDTHCNLLLTTENNLHKIAFDFHKPTYILTRKGLYYLGNPSDVTNIKTVTEDPQMLPQLWETFTGTARPQSEPLRSLQFEEQETIYKLTNNIPTEKWIQKHQTLTISVDPNWDQQLPESMTPFLRKTILNTMINLAFKKNKNKRGSDNRITNHLTCSRIIKTYSQEPDGKKGKPLYIAFFADTSTLQNNGDHCFILQCTESDLKDELVTDRDTEIDVTDLPFSSYAHYRYANHTFTNIYSSLEDQIEPILPEATLCHFLDPNLEKQWNQHQDTLLKLKCNYSKIIEHHQQLQERLNKSRELQEEVTNHNDLEESIKELEKLRSKMQGSLETCSRSIEEEQKFIEEQNFEGDLYSEAKLKDTTLCANELMDPLFNALDHFMPEFLRNLKLKLQETNTLAPEEAKKMASGVLETIAYFNQANPVIAINPDAISQDDAGTIIEGMKKQLALNGKCTRERILFIVNMMLDEYSLKLSLNVDPMNDVDRLVKSFFNELTQALHNSDRQVFQLEQIDEKTVVNGKEHTYKKYYVSFCQSKMNQYIYQSYSEEKAAERNQFSKKLVRLEEAAHDCQAMAGAIRPALHNIEYNTQSVEQIIHRRHEAHKHALELSYIRGLEEALKRQRIFETIEETLTAYLDELDHYFLNSTNTPKKQIASDMADTLLATRDKLRELSRITPHPLTLEEMRQVLEIKLSTIANIPLKVQRLTSQLEKGPWARFKSWIFGKKREDSRATFPEIEPLKHPIPYFETPVEVVQALKTTVAITATIPALIKKTLSEFKFKKGPWERFKSWILGEKGKDNITQNIPSVNIAALKALKPLSVTPPEADKNLSYPEDIGHATPPTTPRHAVSLMPLIIPIDMDHDSGTSPRPEISIAAVTSLGSESGSSSQSTTPVEAYAPSRSVTPIPEKSSPVMNKRSQRRFFPPAEPRFKMEVRNDTTHASSDVGAPYHKSDSALPTYSAPEVKSKPPMGLAAAFSSNPIFARQKPVRLPVKAHMMGLAPGLFSMPHQILDPAINRSPTRTLIY